MIASRDRRHREKERERFKISSPSRYISRTRLCTRVSLCPRNPSVCLKIPRSRVIARKSTQAWSCTIRDNTAIASTDQSQNQSEHRAIKARGVPRDVLECDSFRKYPWLDDAIMTRIHFPPPRAIELSGSGSDEIMSEKYSKILIDRPRSMGKRFVDPSTEIDLASSSRCDDYPARDITYPGNRRLPWRARRTHRVTRNCARARRDTGTDKRPGAASGLS
jgi:hypothetical protein